MGLLSYMVPDNRRRLTGLVLRFGPASGNGQVEEGEAEEEVATYI